MDRLARLLRLEGRAAWRSLRSRPLGRDESIIAFTIVLVLLLRYRAFLNQVAARLKNGDPRPAEAALIAIPLAWVAWLLYSRGAEIPSRLPILPLKFREQFALRVVAGMGSIFSVGLLVISGITLATLCRGPALTVGAGAAAIAYLGGCLAAGSGAACYRDVLVSHRGLAFGGFFLGAVTLAAGLLVLFQSEWAPQHIFLTWTQDGKSWAAALVFTISTLFLASLAIASAGFTRRAKTAAPKIFPFFLTSDRLPLQVPPLLLKDLRLMTRHLETWILLLFSLQGMAYYAFEQNPHPLALSGIALVVLSLFGPVTFNAFGLEPREALHRYRLLAFGGHTLLVSKNRAFFLVTGLLLAPPLILGTFRVGLLAPLTALLSAFMMAYLFALFGNETSVRYPCHCRPYRFTSYGFGSGLLRVLAVQILCSLPGVLVLLLARDHARVVCGLAAIGCIALVTVYKRWVLRQGRRLEALMALGGPFSPLTHVQAAP